MAFVHYHAQGASYSRRSAFGSGTKAGATRSCDGFGFPREQLEVDFLSKVSSVDRQRYVEVGAEYLRGLQANAGQSTNPVDHLDESSERHLSYPGRIIACLWRTIVFKCHWGIKFQFGNTHTFQSAAKDRRKASCSPSACISRAALGPVQGPVPGYGRKGEGQT